MIEDGHWERFAEYAADMLCVADTDGYFVWLNPAWEMLGWTLEELMSRPYLEFVHPDDQPNTDAEASSLATNRPLTLQFVNRYRRADDTYCWLEWSSFRAEDGYIYAVARDVSARIEQQLRQERLVRQLRQAEKLTRTGNWYVDLASEHVEWSPEVYRIHGRPQSYTPTLADGIEAYHPDDRARVQECVERGIIEGSPWTFELRIVRPNGAIRQVRSIGEPEYDPDGNVIGLFGVFCDITDDQRAPAPLEPPLDERPTEAHAIAS